MYSSVMYKVNSWQLKISVFLTLQLEDVVIHILNDASLQNLMIPHLDFLNMCLESLISSQIIHKHNLVS